MSETGTRCAGRLAWYPVSIGDHWVSECPTCGVWYRVRAEEVAQSNGAVLKGTCGFVGTPSAIAQYLDAPSFYEMARYRQWKAQRAQECAGSLAGAYAGVDTTPVPWRGALQPPVSIEQAIRGAWDALRRIADRPQFRPLSPEEWARVKPLLEQGGEIRVVPSDGIPLNGALVVSTVKGPDGKPRISAASITNLLTGGAGDEAGPGISSLPPRPPAPDFSGWVSEYDLIPDEED